MSTVVHPPPAPMSMANTTQPHPPLRRAVYVHVSDLTSAYNIDHARLEEELKRVKMDRENPSEKHTNYRGVPTELDTSLSKPRLQPPRGGYNLCVLVGKVDVVVDKHRVDGSRVRLAEVEVGDETGTVSLRARDEQIDVLREVSERSGAVVLRNCTLELYQGKNIRLAITKWGKLSTYPDQVASTPPPPSMMNQDRNFSLIDLSLVASQMHPQGGSSYGGRDGEGQSASPTNRQQSYAGQATSGRGGGGGRGRRPSRNKMGGTDSNVPAHYSSGGRRYQGGLHGYPPAAYPGGMESQAFSYPSRQPEAQQQMMLQQQYEMQQHQMQQMYRSPQKRQQQLQGSSPMLVPGIPPAASFDTNFSGSSDVPMPLVGSNPFMLPVHGATSPPNQPSNVTARSESPTSPGKMNPQAATFDPKYGKRPKK